MLAFPGRFAPAVPSTLQGPAAAVQAAGLAPRAGRDYSAGMNQDPVVTNPALYRVVFENERVRVLEYLDAPGDTTVEHAHPDSVMVTLSGFRRRLTADGREADVELPAGHARWLPAQTHSGENTGATATHAIFVELKGPGAAPTEGPGALGPADG